MKKRYMFHAKDHNFFFVMYDCLLIKDLKLGREFWMVKEASTSTEV